MSLKKESGRSHPAVIVALGASAGGWEALSHFFANIPVSQMGVAYVVILHSSPDHQSKLPELLAKVTSLEVREVRENLVPKAETVYVVPSNRNVVMKHGRFHLILPSKKEIGPRPSIDQFFISLAKEWGEQAVGVVLSGTGEDGSKGIKAIAASGGVTIAQKPQEAKFDGMPSAAIRTECVDSILDVDEMALKISRIIGSLRTFRVEKIPDDALETIFNLLQEKMNIDFSQYKKTTLTRRVLRRMRNVKIPSVDAYIDYIQSNPEEADHLSKDMLVWVTSFFRDSKAFEYLKKVLQKYAEKHEKEDEFRVWIIGCSSGEEAYSVAIVLDEVLGGYADKKIKIFATDVDGELIQKAREGIYPATAVSNLSSDRLKRYFVKRGDSYKVSPLLKEKLIFLKHDITTDPPFVNLDLVVCRNLLIYFEHELQKRIFTLLSYALKQNGLLFLGKSESIGTRTDLFEPIDPKEKIFESRTITKREKLLYPSMVNSAKYMQSTISSHHKTRVQTLEDAMKNTLYRYYEKKCVVIDNHFNIHYIKGDLNDILHFPVGEMRSDILKMLPPQLSNEIRAMLYNLNRNEIKEGFPLIAKKFVENRKITIKLNPLEGYGNGHYYLLCFEIGELNQDEKKLANETDGVAYVSQLERELALAREHLQTVIEELETSNEELQSSNEELQAFNEELQASNEELETANEELQSTNEELQAAYAEIRTLYEKQNVQKNSLQDKMIEISKLKDELELQYQYTQSILDAEKNIVIVTNGQELLSVNRQFFNFFNEYSTLEDFKKEHRCICDFFEKIEKKDYIYEKKEGRNWLELLLHASSSDMKVGIRRDKNLHRFHIMANDLSKEEKRYVVTLTDITEIIDQKEELNQALDNEIQNNLSSTKIIHRSNIILGHDIFINNFLDEIKKPLNKIYRHYTYLIEMAENQEEIGEKYLQQFRKEKDLVISHLMMLRDFFQTKSGEEVELGAIFTYLADLFTHRFKFFEIKIHQKGYVTLKNRSFNLPAVGLLLMTLLMRVVKASPIKSGQIDMTLKEESGVVSIVVSSQESESVCHHLMQYGSSTELFFDDKKIIHDSYKILTSILEDLYHGTIDMDQQKCKIVIPKRFEG